MQEIYAITLHSAQADAARMDRIGMNLANAATPGYKRDVMAVRPFRSFAQMLGDMAQGTDIAVQADMRPGTIKATGQPLDLAITGDGFFEIATNNGPAYTRQGDFHVDARGRVVTAEGLPVMGQAGEIHLDTLHPTIDRSGNVRELGAQVAQIKIVKFDQPATLTRLGQGLMTGSGGTTSLNDTDVSITQGQLEGANVSSMQEMVEMMQTMRHFESVSKVLQGYDDMMGTAIRKLGDL